jgi:hypothetical protein
VHECAEGALPRPDRLRQGFRRRQGFAEVSSGILKK